MHAPIHAEPMGLPALQLALELARWRISRSPRQMGR